MLFNIIFINVTSAKIIEKKLYSFDVLYGIIITYNIVKFLRKLFSMICKSRHEINTYVYKKKSILFRNKLKNVVVYCYYNYYHGTFHNTHSKTYLLT